ncbi:MAG: adenylate/guanylate cyclase domain-containing protein, partial [Alphaproteobacteria bacterium]
KDPSKIACQAALSAVFKAQARVAELNRERRADGLSDIRYGIGLHVGNVMFGNVGLKDRLTFSAFGSAVNEVQRLQGLTKKYSREVVASQAFATYCGGDWITLGEEKLRGVRQKVTVLLPKPSEQDVQLEDALDEVAYDGLSEAEQVMLLHRDAKTQAHRPMLEKFMQ